MNTETKTTLRLPQGVHARLKERAKVNHRSTNGELVAILEQAMFAKAKEDA